MTDTAAWSDSTCARKYGSSTVLACLVKALLHIAVVAATFSIPFKRTGFDPEGARDVEVTASILLCCWLLSLRGGAERGGGGGRAIGGRRGRIVAAESMDWYRRVDSYNDELGLRRHSKSSSSNSNHKSSVL